jgi:hypothetical protein
MSQVAPSPDTEESQAEDEFYIYSVDRSDEETENKHRVEWREPADKLTLADQIKSLF